MAVNLTTLELLQPQYITEVISKVRVGKGALSRFLNFEIGNSKIENVPVDQIEMRIMNQTRVPSNFTMPGSGPVVIAPNPVGSQRFYMTRNFEKMIFPAEMLGNMAKVEGPSNVLDPGGASYLEDQTVYIGRRFNMAVEFMSASFVRGTMYLALRGDRLVPSLTQPTAPYVTVSFQLPTTNINQLDMGTGTPIIQQSWDNFSTPIVSHIGQIRSAMVAQTGLPLEVITLNGVMWQNVISNISVRAVGGVMDTPFQAWTEEAAKDQDGQPMAGAMKARIKAIPWVEFMIIDDTLAIGGEFDPIVNQDTGANSVGTLTKVIPDTVAMFSPRPDPSLFRMVHGGEWVAENEGVTKLVWKQGLQSWRRFNSEPTSLSICSLLRALPKPKIERCIGWGNVVFTGSPS